jgi:hypothetical protein
MTVSAVRRSPTSGDRRAGQRRCHRERETSRTGEPGATSDVSRRRMWPRPVVRVQTSQVLSAFQVRKSCVTRPDPESRITKGPDGFVHACNAQVAVDERQLIVGQAVTQDTNDKHQLLPVIATIAQQSGDTQRSCSRTPATARTRTWPRSTLSIPIQFFCHGLPERQLPPVTNLARERYTNPSLASISTTWRAVPSRFPSVLMLFASMYSATAFGSPFAPARK